MQLCCLAQDTMQGFRSLLLPRVAAAMDAGEPIAALGIEEDSLACAAMACYIEGRILHIASIYVAPEYRRRGFGARLLRTMEALASTDTERPLADGICIRFTATHEEHEALSRFLECEGFTSQPDVNENVYHFTPQQVAPALQAEALPAGVHSFAELGADVLAVATRSAQAAAAVLPRTALDSESIERDISMALTQNGRVTAFVAFDFSCGGDLTLAALWSGEAGPTAPFLLLRGALYAVKRKYPPDTRLAVETVNEASAKLVAALLPEAKPLARTYFRPIAI